MFSGSRSPLARRSVLPPSPSRLNTTSGSKRPRDTMQWADGDLISYVKSHYDPPHATSLITFIKEFRVPPLALWYLQTDSEELSRLTNEDLELQELVLDLASHVRPAVSPSTPKRKRIWELSRELDLLPPPPPSPPPEPEPELESELDNDLAESIVSDWALEDVPEDELYATPQQQPRQTSEHEGALQEEKHSMDADTSASTVEGLGLDTGVPAEGAQHTTQVVSDPAEENLIDLKDDVADENRVDARPNVSHHEETESPGAAQAAAAAHASEMTEAPAEPEVPVSDSSKSTTTHSPSQAETLPSEPAPSADVEGESPLAELQRPVHSEAEAGGLTATVGDAITAAQDQSTPASEPEANAIASMLQGDRAATEEPAGAAATTTSPQAEEQEESAAAGDQDLPPQTEETTRTVPASEDVGAHTAYDDSQRADTHGAERIEPEIEQVSVTPEQAVVASAEPAHATIAAEPVLSDDTASHHQSGTEVTSPGVHEDFVTTPDNWDEHSDLNHEESQEWTCDMEGDEGSERTDEASNPPSFVAFDAPTSDLGQSDVVMTQETEDLQEQEQEHEHEHEQEHQTAAKLETRDEHHRHTPSPEGADAEPPSNHRLEQEDAPWQSGFTAASHPVDDGFATQQEETAPTVSTDDALSADQSQDAPASDTSQMTASSTADQPSPLPFPAHFSRALHSSFGAAGGPSNAFASATPFGFSFGSGSTPNANPFSVGFAFSQGRTVTGNSDSLTADVRGPLKSDDAKSEDSASAEGQDGVGERSEVVGAEQALGEEDVALSGHSGDDPAEEQPASTPVSVDADTSASRTPLASERQASMEDDVAEAMGASCLEGNAQLQSPGHTERTPGSVAGASSERDAAEAIPSSQERSAIGHEQQQGDGSGTLAAHTVSDDESVGVDGADWQHVDASDANHESQGAAAGLPAVPGTPNEGRDEDEDGSDDEDDGDDEADEGTGDGGSPRGQSVDGNGAKKKSSGSTKKNQKNKSKKKKKKKRSG